MFISQKKNNKNEPNIFLLIYANEKSEAGNYYNDFSLNFILDCSNYITTLNKFDVIESIKDSFINISKYFLEKSEKKEKITKESFESKLNSYIIKLKLKKK